MTHFVSALQEGTMGAKSHCLTKKVAQTADHGNFQTATTESKKFLFKSKVMTRSLIFLGNS